MISTWHGEIRPMFALNQFRNKVIIAVIILIGAVSSIGLVSALFNKAHSADSSDGMLFFIAIIIGFALDIITTFF